MECNGLAGVLSWRTRESFTEKRNEPASFGSQGDSRMKQYQYKDKHFTNTPSWCLLSDVLGYLHQYSAAFTMFQVLFTCDWLSAVRQPHRSGVVALILVSSSVTEPVWQSCGLTHSVLTMATSLSKLSQTHLESHSVASPNMAIAGVE